MQDQRNGVRCIRISPDGKHLVSKNSNGVLFGAICCGAFHGDFRQKYQECGHYDCPSRQEGEVDLLD